VSGSHTQFLTTADDLPEGDYVSPGLEIVCPDRCFPHIGRGDKLGHPWRYLRREVPHNWYSDKRKPLMGFINRDEAVLLYNIARTFRGRRALEIGCWFGWSTCHLALGGVDLDVVDPALAEPMHRESVEQTLTCCGVRDSVRLYAAASPGSLRDLVGGERLEWDLFFIDGDHEPPSPERDIEECLLHASPDAAFVLHDLASPEVAWGLRLLEARGFNILIYQTMQIMGFAWRGRVRPTHHIPDQSVPWQLPHHLVGFPVSGVELPGYPASLRARAIAQGQDLQRKDQELQEKNHELERRDGELQRKDQELQEKNHELERRDGELQRKDQELQEKNHELERRDGELQRKDQELQEKNHELERRDGELQRKDRELLEKNHELERRDGELQRKDRELQEKNHELERRDGELQRKDQDLREKQARAQEHEETIQQLRSELKRRYSFLSLISHWLRQRLSRNGRS
jgi:predicted O-methyltransferase YrrM